MTSLKDKPHHNRGFVTYVTCWNMTNAQIYENAWMEESSHNSSFTNLSRSIERIKATDRRLSTKKITKIQQRWLFVIYLYSPCTGLRMSTDICDANGIYDVKHLHELQVITDIRTGVGPHCAFRQTFAKVLFMDLNVDIRSLGIITNFVKILCLP